MSNNPPIELGNSIFLIDGFDLGMAERTGSYVLMEEQLTLVETSASPSIPHVLEGLQTLGIDPKEISYIIVTHIHLDHAGGVGLLLRECPQAKVVVHPKGARHLINPERLIQGAKSVYGEQFDRLFEPILPVPESSIIVIDDRETLQIGPSRTLQFFDTPGHANHHFSIFDPASNGLFTGDTCGVRYPYAQEAGVFYLPSTSPNQFNPQAMLQSLGLIKTLRVDRIYFGHYGMSTEPDEVYHQIRHWLPVFVSTAERIWQQGKGAEELTAALLDEVQQHLASKGVPYDHVIYQILQLDLGVCAIGLLDYLSKT